MANINDVLKKNKEKIEKIKTERKKIKRKGPVRPWQESLDEYTAPPLKNSDVVPEQDVDSKAHIGLTQGSLPCPIDTTQKVDLSDSRRPKPIPNQNRTNSESITNQNESEDPSYSESIPNHKYYDKNHESTGSTGMKPNQLRTDSESGKAIAKTKPILNRINSESIPNQNFESIKSKEIHSNHSVWNKPVQNRINSGLIPNQNSISSELPLTHKGAHSESETGLIPNQNRIKTESSRPVTINQTSFAKLSNLKQSILNEVFEDCRSRGEKVSRPFRISVLSEKVGCKYDSCRNAIRQLERDGFLNRLLTKRGQGGFIQVELYEQVYTYIAASLQNGLYRGVSERIPNLNRINNESQTESQTESTPSSKLVNNFNKITNYTSTKEDMFSYYENVDFNCLESNPIFQTNKLSKEKIIGEIAKNQWMIKPFDLEELISKFSVYINSPQASNIRSVQSFFFSQLKKIHLGAFIDFEDIKTENDNALLEMKQKMLAKKAERESLKEEIIELAFAEWFDVTTEDVRKELCPEAYTPLFADNYELQMKSLKLAWKSKVWPTTEQFKEFCKAVGESARPAGEPKGNFSSMLKSLAESGDNTERDQDA